MTLRHLTRFAKPAPTRATLIAVRLVLACLLLSAVAPSLQRPRTSDAMTPVVDDLPAIERHELSIGGAEREQALLRAVRDLAENRLDVDALPIGTSVSAWTVDDDIVAFHIGEAPDAAGGAGIFAARIDDDGAQRWVLDDGTSLDGPVLARPVRYLAISSKIGVREHPIRKRMRFHAGTDYAAPTGTPIRVIADGVVTKAERSWTAGNFVVVKHDDGNESKYMHLSARAEGLREGVRVRQGEVIGAVGMTGRVTGPHLHFELRDRFRTPLDPSVMRYPAALVINAHALRTLTLRRELLLTVRADGSPDGSLRLLGAQDGLQRQGEDADGAHALVPPLVGMRGPAVRARLTPPPVRRRRRTCAAIRPLFDDVTARDLADGLCGRAVKLSADFPDLELSTSISATATAERSARISR